MNFAEAIEDFDLLDYSGPPFSKYEVTRIYKINTLSFEILCFDLILEFGLFRG